jgi:hypothetical protein
MHVLFHCSVVSVRSVYHYSMANYVAILKKGMDLTPGGKSEELVPPAERLGEEVDLERRVQLLVDTTCVVLFNFVAQVRAEAAWRLGLEWASDS